MRITTPSQHAEKHTKDTIALEKEAESRIPKVKTPKQIAASYGISLSVFRRWMKAIEHKIGNRVGHFFSIKQMLQIYDHFGRPDTA